MAGKWAALMLAMSVAPAQSAVPEGTYSNICLFPETDDLGGVQLEIGHHDGKPTVLLWVCEGGCGWAEPTSKITVSGNQIAFTAADQSFDASGALAQTTLRRFTATLRGTVLLLESPTFEPKRQQLRKQRIKMTTGNPKAQPSPVRRCR